MAVVLIFLYFNTRRNEGKWWLLPAFYLTDGATVPTCDIYLIMSFITGPEKNTRSSQTGMTSFLIVVIVTLILVIFVLLLIFYFKGKCNHKDRYKSITMKHC